MPNPPAPWEADDAIPFKPEGQEYGYRRWGRLHPCSREKLIARFAWWRVFYPALVWAPETIRLVPPVEWPPLVESVRTFRVIRYGVMGLFFLVFTGLLAWIVTKIPSVPGLPLSFYASPVGGLVLMGLVPLVWSLRNYFAILGAGPDQVRVIGGSARFFAWCRTRRSMATPLILGALVACGLGQWIFGISASLSAAGSDTRSIAVGEIWRILTANFLHLTMTHFIGNVVSIAILAWFVERIAGRSLLLIVVAASALAAGLAHLAEPEVGISAGASGISNGLHGFLLIFSVLHRKSLPPAMWKILLWLAAIEFLSASTLRNEVNAAHVGGLVVGGVLAYWACAKAPLRLERLAGRVAAGLIIASAAGAVGATALKHEGLWGLSQRAYRASNRGNHEAAAQLYTRILAKDPSNTDAYCDRALSRWNLDDYEGALADYDSLLKFSPEHLSGRLGRGELRREMGHLAAATEDLDWVLRRDPDNPRALSERAWVLLLKGDQDSAIQSVSKAVGLTHVDFEDVSLRFQLRDGNDWADRFRENTYALYVRGLIQVARKNYTEAIADYSKAIGQYSEAGYVIPARGEAHWLNGDIEAALADFEQTLKKFERDSDAFLGRGRIRASKGDVKGAREDFEAALQSTNRWWDRRAETEAALKALP